MPSGVFRISEYGIFWKIVTTWFIIKLYVYVIKLEHANYHVIFAVVTRCCMTIKIIRWRISQKEEPLVQAISDKYIAWLLLRWAGTYYVQEYAHRSPLSFFLWVWIYSAKRKWGCIQSVARVDSVYLKNSHVRTAVTQRKYWWGKKFT